VTVAENRARIQTPYRCEPFTLRLIVRPGDCSFTAEVTMTGAYLIVGLIRHHEAAPSSEVS
jgi:hypothetical protein